MSNNFLRNQSGVLLLLALVTTTVILTAALIVATLAIREARVSALSDRGQVALYASESAAEEAIYRIYKLGEDPLTLDGGSGTFSSGATWSRQAGVTADELIFDFVPAGRSVIAQLYHRDNVNDAAGVATVDITWSSGSDLDIDLMEWDGASLIGPSAFTYNCAGSPCSAQLSLNPTSAYELTISASGTAVTDLILALDALIQTPVTVLVQGEYQGARQAVELRLPVPAPWEGAPPAICGNGVMEGSEQCDDGGLVDGDGCSSLCVIE
jgi:cysteine-rich repeat protein